MTPPPVAEDLAAALERSAEAQERGEPSLISEGYDELETRIAQGDTAELTTALAFWDAWIDARDHGWQDRHPFRQEDWPRLARELAADLRAWRPIENELVLREFGPVALSFGRRTIAHYVLLLVAIVFAVEFLLFFTAALTNAGRNQPQAFRYLVLAIATFLTFVASGAMFLRRVPRAGLGLIGLLLVQPAANAIADAVGGKPPGNVLVPAVAAIAGAAALIAVARAARLRRTASESETAADWRR